jgi:hypothetical protein
MFLARNEDGPLPKLRPAAMETVRLVCFPQKARQRPKHSDDSNRSTLAARPYPASY